MKRTLMSIGIILFSMLYRTAFAGPGPLFTVSATGIPAELSITLCLNGTGALSCQIMTVNALHLIINTTIPNHLYSFAGIRINTPGYTIAGCTPNAKGMCLFSVSNTASASISIVIANPNTITIVGQNYSSGAPLLVESMNGGTYWNIPSTSITSLPTRMRKARNGRRWDRPTCSGIRAL